MDLTNPENFKPIADSMGITLYQKFSVSEAALFLRCPVEKVEKLSHEGNLEFISARGKLSGFYGFQLLSYLLKSFGSPTNTPSTSIASAPDRIIRANEVQDMTGLSRTTLWRMENKNEFPRRVSLGGNTVGWKLREVQDWISNRS